MDKVIKSISAKAEKVEKRILRFIGSDSSVDRDGDSITVSAWDLKNYRKNPVVLFGHNQSAEAVARTKKVWIDSDKKQLLFDIEFPEPEVSSKGDSLYKLYKAGYMHATSVSFIPDFSKITYPDRKNNKGPYRIFNGQELMEISLVSVPANARALLTGKSMDEAINKEIICKEEIDELLTALDKIEETPAKEEAPVMDYEKEITALKLEIEELKESNYIFKLFDSDPKEKMYDELLEELSEEDVYERILKDIQ